MSCNAEFTSSPYPESTYFFHNDCYRILCAVLESDKNDHDVPYNFYSRYKADDDPVFSTINIWTFSGILYCRNIDAVAQKYELGPLTKDREIHRLISYSYDGTSTLTPYKPKPIIGAAPLFHLAAVREKARKADGFILLCPKIIREVLKWIPESDRAELRRASRYVKHVEALMQPVKSIEPPSPTSFATDPFFTLPREMLEEILYSLPSDDMASLRLASRAVAQLHPNELPSAFWESRFRGPGGEFQALGAIMPIAQAINPYRMEWFQMYYVARTARYWGVDTLRRIWGKAQIIATLIKNSEGAVLMGVNFEAATIDHGQWNHRVGCLVRPPDGTKLDSHFDRQRIWRAVKVCIPPEWGPMGIDSLGVSLVRVFNRRYISGLRFIPAGAGQVNGSRPACGVGYRHDSTEIVIPLVEGTSGGYHFQFMADRGGLTELRVIGSDKTVYSAGDGKDGDAITEMYVSSIEKVAVSADVSIS